MIICRDLWLSLFTSDRRLSIVFIIQDFDCKDSSLLSLTFLKTIAYLLERSTSFSLHGGNFSLITRLFFLETRPGPFRALVLRRLEKRTNARNVSFIYLRRKLHPCQRAWYQILSTSKSAKYTSWCLWNNILDLPQASSLGIRYCCTAGCSCFKVHSGFSTHTWTPRIISFASKTETSTWTFDFTCHFSLILTSLSQFAWFTQHSLSSPSEAVTINCDEANFPLFTQSDEDEQSFPKRKLKTNMKSHRSLVSHNTRFNYCFPLYYTLQSSTRQTGVGLVTWRLLCCRKSRN